MRHALLGAAHVSRPSLLFHSVRFAFPLPPHSVITPLCYLCPARNFFLFEHGLFFFLFFRTLSEVGLLTLTCLAHLIAEPRLFVRAAPQFK